MPNPSAMALALPPEPPCAVDPVLRAGAPALHLGGEERAGAHFGTDTRTLPPNPHQKKSDSQPMRRPVTLPKVPVATARDVPRAIPARLRDP
jgi:hypothetical protein